MQGFLFAISDIGRQKYKIWNPCFSTPYNPLKAEAFPVSRQAKMPLPLAQGAALNLPENLTEFTPQLASRGVPEIAKILVRSEFTLLQGSRRRRKHLYASPSAEREESKICVLLRDVRLVL